MQFALALFCSFFGFVTLLFLFFFSREKSKHTSNAHELLTTTEIFVARFKPSFSFGFPVRRSFWPQNWKRRRLRHRFLSRDRLVLLASFVCAFVLGSQFVRSLSLVLSLCLRSYVAQWSAASSGVSVYETHLGSL